MTKCDMTKDCIKPISYIDRKGFVYCETHGLQRKAYVPTRKLKPKELKQITDNKPLEKY